MVLTVACRGLGLDAGEEPSRGPQLLVAETGLLKPLDCPGDSNNRGKMSLSPQKEGHSPWEEPLWLQRLPGTGESVEPASMCGCDHWAGHWNCWDLHCFSSGDCG